ncbi:MAG: hypothetical protein ABIC04_06095 [Nanoarchaeota archaeon]
MAGKISSTKRFGPRYGRKTKHRFGTIESEQRKLHKCPYCNAIKVKRVAVGIWICRKCNSKFTGKAYSIKNKVRVSKEVVSKKEENLSKDSSSEETTYKEDTTEENLEKLPEEETTYKDDTTEENLEKLPEEETTYQEDTTEKNLEKPSEKKKPKKNLKRG